MPDEKSVPPLITSAAILYFLPAPLAVIRLAVFQRIPLTTGRVIAWLLVVAFFGWVTRSLCHGKKWSWWWIVLTVATGVVFQFFSPLIPALKGEQFIYWLQTICAWLACIFLLLPSSRKWFSAYQFIQAEASGGTT